MEINFNFFLCLKNKKFPLFMVKFSHGPPRVSHVSKLETRRGEDIIAADEDGVAVVALAVPAAEKPPSGDGAPEPSGASSSAESARRSDSPPAGTRARADPICTGPRTRCRASWGPSVLRATAVSSPRRSVCT